MSLPDGVTTCLVTYGPITDTFGNLADSITVEVVADRTIIHAASGRTMFDVPVAATADAGGIVQVALPHTNQSGFRDKQQNALTGWYYTVTLTARFANGGPKTDRKVFQPVTGQTVVDADLLPSDGMVTPGVTAPTAPVTSVNGQTGAVDLTTTFVSQVEDPDSDLRAAIIALVGEYGGGSGEGPSNVPTLAASGTGWNIPAGSLDNYRTAKTAAKIGGLLEIVAVGDSTTEGQTNISPDAPSTSYSYLARLRELFPTKGIPDAGHGHVNGTLDSPASSGEPDGIGLVTNFTGNANANYLLPGRPVISETPGQTATYTVRGTHARIYDNRLFLMGRFRYRVDGGAWTTVEGYASNPVLGFVDLPGLSSGTHTIEVENIGGRTWTAPADLQPNGPSGSAGPAAGTYYYVVTGDTPDGETTASNVLTVVHNGTSGQTIKTPNNGYNPGNYKVYRGTSISGPFNYLTTTAAQGNGTLFWTDDGTFTPNASIHPPTGPNPVDATPQHCNVSVDALNTSGVALHNFGVRLQRATDITEPDLMTMFGLSYTNDTTPGAAATRPKDARTGVRRPAAVLVNLGLNDMGIDATSSGAATTVAAAAKAKIKNICKAARAADADPIVLIPPFATWIHGADYGTQFIAACKEAANEENAAWFDLVDGALGPASGWAAAGYGNEGDVHLAVAGYKKVAADLFTKILAK